MNGARSTLVLALVLAPAIARAQPAAPPPPADPLPPPTVAPQPVPGPAPQPLAPYVYPPPPVRPTPRVEAPVEKPARSTQYGIGVEATLRWVVTRSTGYQPFSKDDLGFAPGLGASKTLLRNGPLSLALRGGWDLQSATEQARGDEASLTLHHFWAAAEGRYSLAPWLYLLAAVGPAAYYMRASLVDPGSPTPLVRRALTWGVDGTAGAAARIAHVGDEDWPFARFWVTAEVGYALAGKLTMAMSPKADDGALQNSAPVTLPSLRPGGPTWRIGVAATF